MKPSICKTKLWKDVIKLTVRIIPKNKKDIKVAKLLQSLITSIKGERV